MDTKLFVFIFFTYLMFLGCNYPKKDLFEFDPRDYRGDEIKLSELIEDISYIPLDTSIKIDNINIVLLDHNTIYLNSTIGILAFDRNGKLISQIGRFGRGPGEYIFARNFCIDEKSARLYNHANRTKMIQIFSRKGEFLKSITLNDYPGSFINSLNFFNNNLFIYCFGYDSPYEWIVYDTLGNIVKKQNRHIPEFAYNYTGGIESYIFENRLTYYNTWSDTVFSVLPDLSEKPALIIRPGPHRHPRSNLSMEQVLEVKYFSFHLFETKRFYVIRYLYDRKYYIAFIDKNGVRDFLNKYEVNERAQPASGIKNDFDGGLWFFPESYYEENGNEYLIGIQNPHEIKAHAVTDEFRNSNPKDLKKKESYLKLTASLKETDNPVLVLVRLKK